MTNRADAHYQTFESSSGGRRLRLGPKISARLDANARRSSETRSRLSPAIDAVHETPRGCNPQRLPPLLGHSRGVPSWASQSTPSPQPGQIAGHENLPKRHRAHSHNLARVRAGAVSVLAF